MENIEQLIDFVGELKGVVSKHVNCDVELDVVILKLTRKQAIMDADSRFEGMSIEEVEALKQSERADEIEVLQAEAAAAWKAKKVAVKAVPETEVEPNVDEVEPVLTDDEAIVEPVLTDDEAKPKTTKKVVVKKE